MNRLIHGANCATRAWADVAALGLAILAILVIQCVALLVMQHPLICECGHVALWYAASAGPQTSQHLTDPYSFTHIEHGLLFFLLLRIGLPSAPTRYLLIAALGIEATWEITENTPFVIDRYRQMAVAGGYVGDSVINSLGDTLSMAVGFLCASRFSKRTVAGALVVFEIALALGIRDNLTLTVIQLVQPIEALRHWQSGV